MAAQLEITSSPDQSGRLLVVGEIDTHTAPKLVQHLDDLDPSTSVELDLSETSFISSAGLSAILNAQRRHGEHGGSLTVSAADANIARTIELSGLAEVLGLKRDDDDR